LIFVENASGPSMLWWRWQLFTKTPWFCAVSAGVSLARNDAPQPSTASFQAGLHFW
jgi:hypothetical protein